MDEHFLNLKKKYPVMEHLHRKWKFAGEMESNPKVEYATRYFILVRLNKLRHKYKDSEIKELCKKIIKKLNKLKKKHSEVEANFTEVKKLVLEEFKFCQNELKNDIIYPELVYRFYHITTLFEVLTVYDDIDNKTKNDFINKAKLATDLALKTKDKVKNIPISHVSRFSLFDKTNSELIYENKLKNEMENFKIKYNLSNFKMKKVKVSKFDLNQVLSL